MQNGKKIIIAVDGYSSSGKSTMARALAKRLGYRYIDSGAMYRATALYAMRHGFIKNGAIDADALANALQDIHIDFAVMPDGSQHTILNGEDVEREIRGSQVSANVSHIAVIPMVRHNLVTQQQAFGKEKGIIMDGRDIGTTVFPNAELKLFVNAPAETRARRRYKEMLDKGQDIDYESVLANVRERDHIDTTRSESPLRRADDAIDLDNSNMTIAEQDAWLDKIVADRLQTL